MVSGIFAFDGPLYCDRNGNYCNTTITNEMLSRYLNVVDKLYVIMRTFHIEETYEERHLEKIDLGDKISIIELPNLNSPSQFFKMSKHKRNLQKYILESNLIFLRIPSVVCNLIADICQKYKKPYFVEVGGCAWDSYYNHSLIGKVIAPYVYYKQKKTVKYASYGLYVTERWLQNRYPTQGKSIVASNVYLNYFDDVVINNRLDKYRSFRGNYRIGTIANVNVRYKGQEYIIRALAKLKREGIILDYDLVGAGDSSFLKSLASKLGVDDQVHFLGTKLHSEIWSWLDSIDIYAQPSKQEGLPRSVIEAMNRGCLTIGSNVAGNPELLQEDTIFKPNDVNAICGIIKRLINENNHEKRILNNYKKSHEFEISILENRRNLIFKEYRDFVLNK